MVEWIFDALPASGARRGGLPDDYVFDQSVDTFIREVLQNAHDQRLEEAALSAVTFDLIQLSGERKTSFLEAMKWDDLRLHLDGIASKESPTAIRIGRELGEVDEGPLRLLRISDSGTRGLVGGEDQDGENFKALCRNVLDTSESKSTRGGSHGLGKAVLWAFSGVSTVLFHSIIGEGREKGRSRFFAKTALPSHDDVEGKGWDGPGWFGAPDPDEHRRRAVSVWDDDAESLAASLELARPDRQAGTSILIVDLDEPLAERDEPLEELAGLMAQSASRWFWPALVRETLSVRIRVFHDQRVVSDEFVKTSAEVEPFAQAMLEADPMKKARVSGDVAERHVAVDVPATKALKSKPTEPAVEAAAELRIRVSGDGESEKLANHIALIRGAGMVVQYWRSPRHHFGEVTFHGVLRAGLAAGNTASDAAADRFLRSCEPPAHDEWRADTKRQKALYEPGGGASLSRLWERIQSAIDEVLFAKPPSGELGPEGLRKLFRIGAGDGGGSASANRFSTTVIEGVLKEGVWEVWAEVRRHKGDGDWSGRLQLFLDAESGRGSQLEIAGASIEHGEGAIRLDGGSAFIHGDTNQTLTLRLQSAQTTEISSRTRLRLDDRFSAGGVFK